MAAEEKRSSSLVYAHNFARVTSVDGMRVSLSYDLDRIRWPWLSLPAQHPVLVEKYQYFSAVTSGDRVLNQSLGVQTALTRLQWRCEAAAFDSGHAPLGECELWQNDNDMGFEITTRNADRQAMVHLAGTGFAFADRDFAGWRKASRQKALAACGSPPPELTAAHKVGLDERGHSLISDLHPSSDMPCVTALVTSANGFHPAHPFHTGSGDHVNAGHLFDCVLQMAHLLTPHNHPLDCAGGQAEFMRFVELDVPFEIRLADEPTEAAGATCMTFALSQLDRENTRIQLRLRTRNHQN